MTWHICRLSNTKLGCSLEVALHILLEMFALDDHSSFVTDDYNRKGIFPNSVSGWHSQEKMRDGVADSDDGPQLPFVAVACWDKDVRR